MENLTVGEQRLQLQVEDLLRRVAVLEELKSARVRGNGRPALVRVQVEAVMRTLPDWTPVGLIALRVKGTTRSVSRALAALFEEGQVEWQRYPRSWRWKRDPGAAVEPVRPDAGREDSLTARVLAVLQAAGDWVTAAAVRAAVPGTDGSELAGLVEAGTVEKSEGGLPRRFRVVPVAAPLSAPGDLDL